MTLANNIIKFRKENNFTQEDLGKELGISRQSISKWENGETLPSIDNLIMLSGLLNISLDELITGEPYLNFPFHFGKPQSRVPVFLLVGVILLGMILFTMMGRNFIEKIILFVLSGGFLYALSSCTSVFDYKQYYQYWTITKEGITYVDEAKKGKSGFLDELLLPLKVIGRKKHLNCVYYKNISLMEIKFIPYKFNPSELVTISWASPRVTHIFRENFILKITTKVGEEIFLDLSSSFIKGSKECTMLPTIISFFKRKNFEYKDEQNIEKLRKSNPFNWISQLYNKKRDCDISP